MSKHDTYIDNTPAGKRQARARQWTRSRHPCDFAEGQKRRAVAGTQHAGSRRTNQAINALFRRYGQD